LREELGLHYRKFWRLDFAVSVLGFGCMRLPVREGEAGKSDEDEAIRMICYAVDHGVNYVDTAYRYHEGKSEIVVGKALEDGYRERIRPAIRSPVSLVKSRDHFDRFLDE